MKIRILLYLFILFIICGNIIFGNERALSYPNSNIEDIRVKYFIHVVGIVLCIDNTLIRDSEVQIVRNYDTHLMSGFRRLVVYTE